MINFEHMDITPETTSDELNNFINSKPNLKMYWIMDVSQNVKRLWISYMIPDIKRGHNQ